MEDKMLIIEASVVIKEELLLVGNNKILISKKLMKSDELRIDKLEEETRNPNRIEIAIKLKSLIATIYCLVLLLADTKVLLNFANFIVSN